RKVGVESGAKFRIHVTVRRLLFAVWLVDYAVDVKRAENSGGAIIGDNNYAVATRCDKRMITRGHGISASVRRADNKRHKRNCQKTLANVSNHCRTISKTSLPASPVGRRTRCRNRGRRSRCASWKPNLHRCARRRDDQTRYGLREFFRP